MPKVIDTIRFLEWGKPSPANSRFHGIITAEKIFGTKGYMDYTGRKEAVEDSIKDKPSADKDGFLGYTSRGEATEGSGTTMSSIGVLTPDKRKEFRKIGSEAFSKKGDLIWDMVISLESYEDAHKKHLYHSADYAAVIERILPQFFKKVGFDPDNMIWWMDYHKNKDHPHMHVAFLEKVHTRNKGRFTERQLQDLKRIIVKEMSVRETIQELTGNDYETQFRLKDQQKSEMIEVIKSIDFSKINTVMDLAKILPGKGRLQYGSERMAPYRDAIDKITDSILLSDKMKDSYAAYMKTLAPFDQAMNQDAGADIATLRRSELNKLHKEVGNIILKEIKQYMHNSGSGKVAREDLLSLENHGEERMFHHASGLFKGMKLYRGYKNVFQNACSLKDSLEKERLMKNAYAGFENVLRMNPSEMIKAAAYHRLASMNFYGEGTEKNLEKAESYGMKAMLYSSNYSYALMSRIFFAEGKTGKGINTLYAGTLSKDPASMYLYGINLIQGKRIAQDKVTGFAYVRESAFLGFAPAQQYLEHHDYLGYRDVLQASTSGSVHSFLGGHASGIKSEVAGYVQNDDRIHQMNDRIDSEIEAYLNNSAKPVKRTR